MPDLSKYAILNLHGFRGSSNNTNCRILERMGLDVTSFQIDYERENLNELCKELATYLSLHYIHAIVATSFGSFIGKHLSIEFKLPLIATNPCLIPNVSLRRIAPEYFVGDLGRKNEETCKRWQKEHKGTYSFDSFIIGSDDNVIDHSITYSEAAEATFYKVQGKHQLSAKQYSTLLEDLVKKGLAEEQ